MIALLATVVALVVAIALSPLWPIGLARVAEPSPGIEVNVAVIGIGMLAVFLGVLLTGAADDVALDPDRRRTGTAARTGPVHRSWPASSAAACGRCPWCSAPARPSTAAAAAPRCRCAPP